MIMITDNYLTKVYDVTVAYGDHIVQSEVIHILYSYIPLLELLENL